MERRLFTLSALAASGAVFAQKSKITLPAPYATPSSNNRPQVVSRPDGAQLKLPAGFSIEEFATGFSRPRFMLQGANGEILITDTNVAPNGVVYALTNNGKDKKKIIEGLDRPYGLALYRDWLYVGEPTSIKRYRYDSKSLAAAKGEEVVSYAGLGKGHNSRTILFDLKKEKMYVSCGSESNATVGEDPRRAALNEYNPDGSGHRIYAAGLRNIIGLRHRPGTSEIWAAVQERDGLGDDLVPDYLVNVKDGGFYGWPYAYTGPNEDPTNKGKNPDLVKKTLEPDFVMGAHVAVLDMLFYTGNQFPKKFKEGVFVAQHGSWNRSQRIGYSIAFVPFKGGKPVGPKEDFLTGWMLAPDKREVWGRPVGFLQLPDGSLLLSDDGGNKVWRISYKG